MNSIEIMKNICRTCLDESAVIDWNNLLHGYNDITYKECFYKYTQLNCSDTETYHFSSMLCQICSNSLYDIHTFILKALESDQFFQTSAHDFQLENSIDIKDVKYVPQMFESILLEKLDDEPILQAEFVTENTDEEHIANKSLLTWKPDIYKPVEKRKRNNKKLVRQRKRLENHCPSEYNEKKSSCTFKKAGEKSIQIKSNCDSTIDKDLLDNKIGDDHDIIADEIENNTKSFIQQLEPKERKKYKEVKKPRMCSICSKILHNTHAVELHEKTHLDNRERNETCKFCGLKFYDKRNLYAHKRIHKENREKRHKCEFCEKAFYEKGGLNIHRRIHLGLMVPCSLCSKQFYRQIDLDRHMGSHSATTISSDTKKRSRYFVNCKHCGKSILSTSFKSHTAAHLNEPLMKCSICSKEFFRRASCVLHIKKAHQKTNEEYNDFIILYTKNRLSHLFLEQKTEIRCTDE